MSDGQSLFHSRECRTVLPPQKLRVAQCDKFVGGILRVLGCEVGGRALLKDANSIRKTTFIHSEIGETGRGHGSSCCAKLLELMVGFGHLRQLSLSELGLCQSQVRYFRGGAQLYSRSRLLLTGVEIPRVRTVKRKILPRYRSLRRDLDRSTRHLDGVGEIQQIGVNSGEIDSSSKVCRVAGQEFFVLLNGLLIIAGIVIILAAQTV